MCAASLPLGSISPYNNSFSVSLSPDCRFAEVPETSTAESSIVTWVYRSIYKVSIRFRTVYIVIIFVKLATSRRSFSNRPNRTSLDLRSKTTHDSALTGGAGLSIRILVSLISSQGKLDDSLLLLGNCNNCVFHEFLRSKSGFADFWSNLQLNTEVGRVFSTFCNSILVEDFTLSGLHSIVS